MAIYNIDNIRSINEDKSDIARYDATAKERARRDSKSGHSAIDLGDGITMKKESSKKTNRDADKIMKDHMHYYSRRRLDGVIDGTKNNIEAKRNADKTNNNIANEYLDKDRLNADIDKARIERKLKESKAKQAKLKEAAQYILDILDEND